MISTAGNTRSDLIVQQFLISGKSALTVQFVQVSHLIFIVRLILLSSRSIILFIHSHLQKNEAPVSRLFVNKKMLGREALLILSRAQFLCFFFATSNTFLSKYLVVALSLINF